MATSSGYDDERLISKGLYRIVSDVVGPECIVKQRRQRYEILDTFYHSNISDGSFFISSGSRAEGFEFKSSDFDMMYVDKNAIVMSDPTILTISYTGCVEETTVEILKTLENILMLKPETMEILYAVHLKVNRVLQQYAENLLLSSYSGWPTYHRNKKRYEYVIKAFRMINMSKTYFCTNYSILIKHLYMAGNYKRTIEMMHYVKHKLQSQPYMYRWNLDTDIIMTLLQQGMPHDTVIKSYIVTYVKITDLNIIEELRLECWARSDTTGSSLLIIPSLVFLNFLLILSYTRLGEKHRRIDVLDELQTLVYYDDGYHISTVCKAVSWEILGICQQICGDRHGALQSYTHAL
ncbi:hypothetical protein FSP39_020295 [Pinctada imbricata]|uniref:Uncharacterized protein n=1 Tax=Pinctada imbricata TaxID=66713 RepID=A0AA89BL36_PINIB|nr:hypothetical protein FSP39_020295 [Pinctada imbricata]